LIRIFERLSFGGKSALRLVGAVHDMAVAAGSFYLSFLIVLGFDLTNSTAGIPEKTALFAVGSGVIFFMSSLNAGSWRYASLPDLTAIVKASSFAVIGYVIVQFLYSRGSGLPRAVPVILWLLLIASLAGPRVIYRLIKEGAVLGLVTGISWPKPGAKQVLIYRMNDIAEAYIRAVRLRNDSDVFIPRPRLNQGVDAAQGHHAHRNRRGRQRHGGARSEHACRPRRRRRP
jgi:FlaA1/EpsC-like NDP-sugar epimerase